MTEEQRELLLAAKASLKAARLLKQQGMPGFAAARAYYTMFYVAKALLLGKGRDYSKHSAVISAFGKEFAAAGIVPKEMHRALIRAQDARLAGDYLTGPLVPETELAELLMNAQQFIDCGEQIIGAVSDVEPE